MGIINRFRGGTTAETSSGSDSDHGGKEKTFLAAHTGNANEEERAHIEQMNDPTQRLHRGLKARQVTMIAIGGAM